MMAGQPPQDLKMTNISTTIRGAQMVGEFILSFTHDVAMDWLLPGVPPTGNRVEIPMVVAFSFKDGKLASERIYCDQASMLVQIGILDPGGLPIAGLEGVRKLRQLTGIGQETD
jgi:carboxymethylenebutenolidase